jgi:hypothetical protein
MGQILVKTLLLVVAGATMTMPWVSSLSWRHFPHYLSENPRFTDQMMLALLHNCPLRVVILRVEHGSKDKWFALVVCFMVSRGG